MTDLKNSIDLEAPEFAEIRTANHSLGYEEVGRDETTRFENIHTEIFESSNAGSIAVANEIATLITEKQGQGEPCVLGLATGSSPIKVYQELVRLHEEEGLSFNNVVTFNLDEYYGLEKTDVQSYHYFMHQHLFDHVDIPKENVNIPDGTLNLDDVSDYCYQYDEKIDSFGGLDFQLLGIGRTGHIGFNEPGSHKNSMTRMVVLDHLTRSDAASEFRGIENVPSKAITMGVKSIKSAKRIVIMAWGIKKAEIVGLAIEGAVTSDIPATYLQDQQGVTMILDQGSCLALKRFSTPWLVGPVTWSEQLKRKAVIWLSHQIKKTILKLTDHDYYAHGLADLVATEESGYKLNIKIHNYFQKTITGWPGGKENESSHPERKDSPSKRVILFSPHPDDDVISMGGTFMRLVEQGHDVHVAYQTSGNFAVADKEALRFAEFTHDICQARGDSTHQSDQLIKYIRNKNEGEIDSVELRTLKGLIRKGEAIAGARYCGLKDGNIHFLNLPFYESGTKTKRPFDSNDIKITSDLIRDVKPHQIYAAGDLADPHGTHKTCFEILLASLESLKGTAFLDNCWFWLYSGAWDEWPIDKIDMAVPLSPGEVLKKRQAIFCHQSQKDGAVYQGDDLREFWQRAEERNANTASKYNLLGLTEYQAIEAFVRYHY